MRMSIMKRRSVYLDSVGGIMVIYMMFYHCSQFSKTTELPFLQSTSIVFTCFMAWFFFKSGMFYKNERFGEMRKKVKKLLRPYCAFMLIGYAAYCVDLFIEHDYNWIHYILSPIKQCLLGGGVHAWALPMWFLVTLAVVKCLAPFLLNKYKMGGVIACGLIGFLLALYSEHYHIIRPFYVVNFFPAMFFYGMGFYMKEKQYHRIILFFALTIYSASFVFPSTVDFQTNKLIQGNYFLWLIYAFAGIVVFDNVTKIVKTRIWLFTSIGEKSMYWFLAHWVLLKIISITLQRICPDLTGVRLLVIIFTSLMTLLAILQPVVYHTNLKKWLGV